MGLKIVSPLIANPSNTGLPGRITLRQTIQSNFPGGEAAQITYTVQGGGKVLFEGGGTTFNVAGVHVPESPLQREDSMGLVWIGGAPESAQIPIQQDIVGIEDSCHDSVVITIHP
ncbi:MAG TPA: hypothetical protein VN493_02715 [Thermoanaerobaculia bacterium]|nr:hypothetical protein [Thermoanaerobaculia bacterium]